MLFWSVSNVRNIVLFEDTDRVLSVEDDHPQVGNIDK